MNSGFVPLLEAFKAREIEIYRDEELCSRDEELRSRDDKIVDLERQLGQLSEIPELRGQNAALRAKVREIPELWAQIRELREKELEIPVLQRRVEELGPWKQKAAELQSEVATLRENELEIPVLRRQVEEQRQAEVDLNVRLAHGAEQLGETQRRLAALEVELRECHAARGAVEERLTAVLASTSWRLTRPIRKVLDRLRGNSFSS